MLLSLGCAVRIGRYSCNESKCAIVDTWAVHPHGRECSKPTSIAHFQNNHLCSRDTHRQALTNSRIGATSWITVSRRTATRCMPTTNTTIFPKSVTMPSTRITVALNSNQTLRAPLLIPDSAPTDPTQPNSIRALVFKTAQSKLRIKKPTRVFRAGSGKELTAEEDWRRCCAGKDDITVLVSKGEEYVGLKREVRSSGEYYHDQDAQYAVHAIASHRIYIIQYETNHPPQSPPSPSPSTTSPNSPP